MISAAVKIRDSKMDTREGFPALTISAADWAGFLGEVTPDSDR